MSALLTILCTEMELIDPTPLDTKFRVGDRAYIRREAERFKFLEKVIIKRIVTFEDTWTPFEFMNYIDTFNWPWKEGDLVTYAEAVQLAGHS